MKFDSLIDRMLLTELFDKSYPLEDKKVDDVSAANIDKIRAYLSEISELYHFGGLDENIRNDMRKEIIDIKQKINTFERENKTNTIRSKLTGSVQFNTKYDRILKLASERYGKSTTIFNLNSIQLFLLSLLEPIQNPDEEDSDITYIDESITQNFTARAGLIKIVISPNIEIVNKKIGRYGFSTFDIVFKSPTGGYEATLSGDAPQVVMTVMDFAFAVFCIFESFARVCSPEIIKILKETRRPLMHFSPAANDSNLNMSSKMAREGVNKRNRLYSVAWKKAMQNRIPDIELIDTELVYK